MEKYIGASEFQKKVLICTRGNFYSFPKKSIQHNKMFKDYKNVEAKCRKQHFRKLHTAAFNAFMCH